MQKVCLLHFKYYNRCLDSLRSLDMTVGSLSLDMTVGSYNIFLTSPNILYGM